MKEWGERGVEFVRCCIDGKWRTLLYDPHMCRRQSTTHALLSSQSKARTDAQGTLPFVQSRAQRQGCLVAYRSMRTSSGKQLIAKEGVASAILSCPKLKVWQVGRSQKHR